VVWGVWWCIGFGGVVVWGCTGVVVWGCGGCGGVGGVVGVVGVVWVCGGVGWFPLAFEHSKVCTLCDFGHLQFYIKIIFSGCVIGTPVNFGGMTGRALAVILKLNFFKSCDHKKSYI
jgi:hypothetical protein